MKVGNRFFQAGTRKTGNPELEQTMNLLTGLLLTVARDPHAVQRDASGKLVIPKAAVEQAQRGDQLRIEPTHDAFVLTVTPAAEASRVLPAGTLVLPPGAKF